MILDRSILDRLFSLAMECISNGNRPMPAILLKDGKIEYESQDMVMATCDPTMHGEIVVIRTACTDLDQPHLREYEMVTFGEPCLMCCGAIHWAKLNSM